MTGERPEELAKAGLEHLQAAAREVIQATRSLLDAAEELVDDPSAVQSLVGTIASVAQAAAGRVRGATPGAGDGPDDDGDDGRVQRIRVS
jgi:hypothetical protein